MTVSMPIGKLLRREDLHIDYLPGGDKAPFSNACGIAVKQYSDEPDVAILDREGPDVDHSLVRRMLVANGYKLWIKDDKVLIGAAHEPAQINVDAWRRSNDS